MPKDHPRRRIKGLVDEALDYNLLFGWFLDLNLLEPVRDNSAFTKNQDRLLRHPVAEVFFARGVNLARAHGWASDAHFTVDGTLIEAWASLKSFQPKSPAGRRSGQPRGGLPRAKAQQRHAPEHDRRGSLVGPQGLRERGAAGLRPARAEGEPPRPVRAGAGDRRRRTARPAKRHRRTPSGKSRSRHGLSHGRSGGLLPGPGALATA